MTEDFHVNRVFPDFFRVGKNISQKYLVESVFVTLENRVDFFFGFGFVNFLGKNFFYKFLDGFFFQNVRKVEKFDIMMEKMKFFFFLGKL